MYKVIDKARVMRTTDDYNAAIEYAAILFVMGDGRKVYVFDTVRREVRWMNGRVHYPTIKAVA